MVSSNPKPGRQNRAASKGRSILNSGWPIQLVNMFAPAGTKYGPEPIPGHAANSSKQMLTETTYWSVES